MLRACGIVACLLTACRESPKLPETSADPKPEAEAVQVKEEEEEEEDPWRELRGHWDGAMGGEVSEADGVLRLGWGEMLTAARWTGETPGPGFELEGEARRVDGVDFFFSATFPVREAGECVTLVVGGWGGGVVGISSIDGMDASENETTTFRSFETGRWYAIRLRSEPERVRVWIDDEEVIDFATADHRLSLRPGPIDACLPFGLATWQTTGEMRGLRWRPLGREGP